MLKRLGLLAVLVVAPLISGCRLDESARAADVSSVPVGYAVGQRAPSFDLLAVGEGQSIRSADLRGKPVILNFYCGCNFCSTVGREWVKNKDKVGDAVVLAVMINHWNYAPEAIRKYREKTGWSWPVLADMQSETADKYDALTCPRLFVIDRHGIIRYASVEGASDEKKLVSDALAAAHAS
jgi:peroxiredoxin